MSQRKIVFSGIQPSGDLHLGNYLGAISRWVAHQDTYDSVICVVDLHAITVPQDPETLRTQTRELFCMLMACGIDPNRTLLFVQSHVTAHAELAWILNCVTPLGWLERMIQFKDKSSKQESVLTGLLDYPVLQAADILLYQAHLVPVGEDQRQHIELTRDIAGRFNHLYGETFTLPEPFIAETGARIMSLDDPTAKMSKSTDRRYHAISLLDEPDAIMATVKRAVTDSGREIVFSDDPEKAGVQNLLTIYQLMSGQTPAEAENHFSTARGYGDLKREVAEVVIEKLKPIRNRYDELINDRAELDRLIQAGTETAMERSAPTLEAAKTNIGFLATLG